jgi:hypothetical protein
MLLLQGVDFATDHLDLLDMAGDYCSNVSRWSTLPNFRRARLSNVVRWSCALASGLVVQPCRAQYHCIDSIQSSALSNVCVSSQLLDHILQRLRRRCSLTLTFVVNATLRFRLELSPDVVEKLIEALSWTGWGSPHDAGRWVTVVHDGYSAAVVWLGANM